MASRHLPAIVAAALSGVLVAGVGLAAGSEDSETATGPSTSTTVERSTTTTDDDGSTTTTAAETTTSTAAPETTTTAAPGASTTATTRASSPTTRTPTTTGQSDGAFAIGVSKVEGLNSSCVPLSAP